MHSRFTYLLAITNQKAEMGGHLRIVNASIVA